MTISADTQRQSYLVTKPFKYNGKEFKKDDMWTPEDGFYDRLLISQGKVINNQHPMTPEEIEARGRRYNGAMTKFRGVKLPAGISAILMEAGIDPSETADLSDADLKDIKGIGPAAVKTIRKLEWVADYAEKEN